MIVPVGLYNLGKLANYNNTAKETPEKQDVENPAYCDPIHCECICDPQLNVVPEQTPENADIRITDERNRELVINQDGVTINYHNADDLTSSFDADTGSVEHRRVGPGSLGFYRGRFDRDQYGYIAKLFLFLRAMNIILKAQPSSVREEVISRLPEELKMQYENYRTYLDLYDKYSSLVSIVSRDYGNMSISGQNPEDEDVRIKDGWGYYELVVNQDGATIFYHDDDARTSSFDASTGRLEYSRTGTGTGYATFYQWHLNRDNSDYVNNLTKILRDMNIILKAQPSSVREEVISRLPEELRMQYELYCTFSGLANNLFPGISPDLF